ncbi:MAG: alcohol dehydrogenase catalytic domain-containing protein [Clostridia bacterium]
MIIANKKNFSDVVLKEMEIPQAKKNEVLLKVCSCGVCGGDLNSSEEYRAFGHEMAGYVEKIGENVSNVSVGDRVVVESTSFCGACDNCKNGQVDLCSSPISSLSNGFAEYAVVKSESCVILPDDVSFKYAAIIEPLGVAIDLVKTAKIEMGDHVLIYGTGSIGLMALQLAKRNGASKVFAVLRSRSKKKAELALKFGADEIIYSDKTNLLDFDFPKSGVDKALVTAQNYVIPEVLEILNYNGTLAFLGFGGEPMITINANKFHVNKLQLKGAYSRPGIYFPLAIEMIRTGGISAEDMISHCLPLKDISKLMSIAGNERDKVVKAVMLAENCSL